MTSPFSSNAYLLHRQRLISYACARGCAVQDAEDLVQDLFASLVRVGRYDELARLASGDQAATLSCRLRSLMANRWRDLHRQRRDARRTVSYDEAKEMVLALSIKGTPATELDAAWALAAIETAIEQVRLELTDQQWRLVEPVLRGGDAVPQACNGRARVALCRARKRLRALVPHADIHAALCSSSSLHS